MQSYHFNCGNSSAGPIGFCARVNAESKKKAVKILNEDLVNLELDATSGAEGIEYLRVYFGKVDEEDIDEVD